MSPKRLQKKKKRFFYISRRRPAFDKWTNTDTFNIVKETWPDYNKSRTIELLRRP